MIEIAGWVDDERAVSNITKKRLHVKRPKLPIEDNFLPKLGLSYGDITHYRRMIRDVRIIDFDIIEHVIVRLIWNADELLCQRLIQALHIPGEVGSTTLWNWFSKLSNSEVTWKSPPTHLSRIINHKDQFRKRMAIFKRIKSRITPELVRTRPHRMITIIVQLQTTCILTLYLK